ncbi:MAG: 50S ribosomal protein L22 [Candidatus Pacebacteria bacterium]|nr:50S ribosomal protein L22 [Candidatus Paceibacterota bacterium]
MKAYLKSYRQAPRKVRLVANLMKGKTAERALVELSVLPKRASEAMKKLLLSAIANAKENDHIGIEELFVKEVRVDQGMILKRFIPKSHGSASPIHKHTSHVMIELIPRSEAPKSAVVSDKKTKADKAVKVVAKKTAKKETKKEVAPKTK